MISWLRRVHLLGCLILLVGLCTACQQDAPQPLELASLTQNGVQVSLLLVYDDQGQALLEATFTPEDADAHLYSKDLPLDGLDGLGRPTRLDLPAESTLQPRGDLQESAVAESLVVMPELPALPVYPAGPVTLRLPVTLPPGGAESAQVLITYMACTPRGCNKPVVNQAVDLGALPAP